MSNPRTRESYRRFSRFAEAVWTGDRYSIMVAAHRLLDEYSAFGSRAASESAIESIHALCEDLRFRPKRLQVAGMTDDTVIEVDHGLVRVQKRPSRVV